MLYFKLFSCIITIISNFTIFFIFQIFILKFFFKNIKIFAFSHDSWCSFVNNFIIFLFKISFFDYVLWFFLKPPTTYKPTNRPPTISQPETDQLQQPPNNRPPTNKKFENQKNNNFIFHVNYDFEKQNTQYFILYILYTR